MILFLLAVAVPTKVAVVVGANAGAPGYAALHYAYNDAERMASTLERVGEFQRDDIIVLHDPRPQELIGALAQAAARVRARTGAESMLFFYYSGHADEQSVFPHGEALALADVRTALDNVGSTVRVGVIDACRGGGWTQAKGLSASAAITLPEQLLSAGSALIAASSGLENAHESEALAGSFFTHYFTAGLLGAADQHHDGHITLTEAFEYAKERTIRDTAQVAPEPQHPSFDINLRGRQDLVLAEVRSSPSVLEVEQDEGPLDIVHLGSGLRILELPSGKTALTLALPPGRYLVRREHAGHIYATEVEVRPGSVERVQESDLKIVGSGMLAFKGLEEPPPRADETTTLKHHYDLTVAAGWSDTTQSGSSLVFDNTPSHSFAFEGLLAGSLGITDRLEWFFPGAFAYRFGERGHAEIVPYAGLTAIGYSSEAGPIGNAEAGADVRFWLSGTRSLLAQSELLTGFGNNVYGFDASGHNVIEHRDVFSNWRSRTSFGATVTLRNVVTLAAGVSFASDWLTWGTAPRFNDATPQIGLGSVQSLALRRLPLVQVALTRIVNFDVYASVKWELVHGGTTADALAGFTFTF